MAEIKQYCRYCANCFLQGDDVVYCEPKKQMREKKNCITVNRCKHFELNPNDVFSANEHGDFREYKPRRAHKPGAEQIKESGQQVLDFDKVCKQIQILNRGF